jgi:hypothetical protein
MKLSDLTKIDLSIKMVSDQMIAALFRFETNIEYRRYQQAVKSAGRTVVNSTRNSKNSYVANLYSDRSKEHLYDNGTRKETLESGYTIIYFKNGDIKQVTSYLLRPCPTRPSSTTSRRRPSTRSPFPTPSMYLSPHSDLPFRE